jgi:hypothetical protein
MNNMVIPPQVIETSDIALRLEQYVKNKGDRAWLDFYAGGAGQTLLELIAVLGSFDAYYRMVLTREMSLDFAQQESSVKEHAFNRGVITTVSKTLKYNLRIQAYGQVDFYRGQPIGILGDYIIYCLDNISAINQTFNIEVVVGHLIESKKPVSLSPLSTIEFSSEFEFVADSLERFEVNNEPVTLLSELNYLHKYNNRYCLRRVLPGSVRIYIGNGILGFYDSKATHVSYTFLGYNKDILSVVKNNPTFSIDNARLIDMTVIDTPTFGPSIDELRVLSVYYPLDGRIVQDKDYEGLILNHFGGILHDVYSFNLDPDQQVYLLTDPSTYSDSDLNNIKELVDSRRALGIKILYEVIDASNGKVLNFFLKVESKDYTKFQLVRTEVVNLLKEKTHKFMRRISSIKTSDVAVELTERFNCKFYVDIDSTYNFQPNEFITDINLQVNVL